MIYNESLTFHPESEEEGEKEPPSPADDKEEIKELPVKVNMNATRSSVWVTISIFQNITSSNPAANGINAVIVSSSRLDSKSQIL